MELTSSELATVDLRYDDNKNVGSSLTLSSRKRLLRKQTRQIDRNGSPSITPIQCKRLFP